MKIMHKKILKENIASVVYISSLLLTLLEVSDESLYPQQRMDRNICEFILVGWISATGSSEEMALELYRGRM